MLQKVNELLVKAKPSFHKQTFLKPFHKTAEFLQQLPQSPLAQRCHALQRFRTWTESLRQLFAERCFRSRCAEFLLSTDRAEQLQRMSHAAIGLE